MATTLSCSTPGCQTTGSALRLSIQLSGLLAAPPLERPEVTLAVGVLATAASGLVEHDHYRLGNRTTPPEASGTATIFSVSELGLRVLLACS